ncbi:MAG: gluconate 2-dehydrogenase subunit 3 family protein [Bacteroidia bacterium]|nr:gluconate 2-dehydrogenase subunit 3 family protein [Bacteroidia bacterium]
MAKQLSRRESLKYLAAGAAGAGLTLAAACNPAETTAPQTPGADTLHQHHHAGQDYQLAPEDQALMAEPFFTEHEMKTVRVLSDLIIPADSRSGGAVEAGAPEFIEFMMKDQPKFQTPMRGGLRWVDVQSIRMYEKPFVDCDATQQKGLLDLIAWPAKAAPEHSQGVTFFNMMRDLVATGFFTSKMGMEDLQYMGNRPNDWQGAPQAWLDRLGVSYENS